MTKQHLILGLILGGCVAAVACSSDGDDTSPTAGGAGGTAGSAGSAGAHAGGTGGDTHAGGSGGTTAGAANEAGAGGSVSSAGASEGGASEGGATTTSDAGAGGEAGAPVVVVVPPAPLDPDAVVVTSAAPTAFNHLLVTGTNYAVQGEVASVTLSPAAVEDSTAYPDDAGDVITVSSGGLGFVLQRTEDKVNLIEGSKIKTTFDITQVGTGATVDLAHKAYVPVYNYNFISVLDLDAGIVAGRIDLSQFNDPDDSDGSVNTVAGVYDPAKKVAYFVLERIDLGSYDANFNLPCSATRALVVGIDATTDTIVDLNGNASGKALSLYLANPTEAQLSADGKTITVLANGCYDGDQDRQGVELVHLDTGSTTIAFAPTDGSKPTDLILLGGQQALLQPNFGVPWQKLDLSTGTIGATLNNVPLEPVFDGTNVFGVTIDPTTQAANVVRYDIAGDVATTIAPSPWVGKYSFANPSALVP
jgi:hypothetical protein